MVGHAVVLIGRSFEDRAAWVAREVDCSYVMEAVLLVVVVQVGVGGPGVHTYRFGTSFCRVVPLLRQSSFDVVWGQTATTTATRQPNAGQPQHEVTGV
jgi:hypothetical protein